MYLIKKPIWKVRFQNLILLVLKKQVLILKPVNFNENTPVLCQKILINITIEVCSLT